MYGTLILYRKAKLFYKLYKLTNDRYLTGYSYNGVSYHPERVDNMRIRMFALSYTYPLVGHICEEDIVT
jgi:hypothetical protein